MKFSQLAIGARFRLVREPGIEWRKINTIEGESNGEVQPILPRTLVNVPPYNDEPLTSAEKSATRYQQFAAKVNAAGWSSPAAFQTAVINGVVTLPQNPNQ